MRLVTSSHGRYYVFSSSRPEIVQLRFPRFRALQLVTYGEMTPAAKSVRVTIPGSFLPFTRLWFSALRCWTPGAFGEWLLWPLYLDHSYLLTLPNYSRVIPSTARSIPLYWHFLQVPFISGSSHVTPVLGYASYQPIFPVTISICNLQLPKLDLTSWIPTHHLLIGWRAQISNCLENPRYFFCQPLRLPNSDWLFL